MNGLHKYPQKLVFESTDKHGDRYGVFQSWKIHITSQLRVLKFLPYIKDPYPLIPAPKDHLTRDQFLQLFEEIPPDVEDIDIDEEIDELIKHQDEEVVKWEAECQQERDHRFEAASYILLALDRNLTRKIDAKNPQAISDPLLLWKLLCEEFEQLDEATHTLISDELQNLKVSDFKTVTDYALKMRYLNTRLMDFHTEMSEKRLISIFTQRISAVTIWQHLVNGIRLQINITPTLEQVAELVHNTGVCSNIIKSDGSPVRNSESTTKTKVLKVNKGQSTKNKNKKNMKKKPKGKQQLDITCFGCGKRGHYKRDCRSKHLWKAYAKQQQSESSANAVSAESEDSPPPAKRQKTAGKDARVDIQVNVIRAGSITSHVNVIKNTSKVIIDSGAEISVFGKIHHSMSDIIAAKNQLLIYGNGEKARVEKLASIGRMENVHICAKNADNIASISQLTDMGFNVLITDSFLYVMKATTAIPINARDVVLMAERDGGLYTVHTDTFVNAIGASDESPDIPTISNVICKREEIEKESDT